MDHQRTLGMIPGFKPPKGTVKPPQGFSRLPTAEEMRGVIKSWAALRCGVDPYLHDLRVDVGNEEQCDAVGNYNRTWGGDEV